jgi:hypothetical protein
MVADFQWTLKLLYFCRCDNFWAFVCRSHSTIFYMDLCIIILQLSINYNILYLCFIYLLNMLLITVLYVLYVCILTELRLICMSLTCFIFYGLWPVFEMPGMRIK